MEGQWCTIESDPDTLTELAHKLGVLNVQFIEILDLDTAGELLTGHPVFGFLFLFKWQDMKEEISDAPEDDIDNVLFIKQVVTNACASVSILNIALNVSEVELSGGLKGFADFVWDMPSDMKGLALTNCEEIRKAHNSFITHGSLNADDGDDREGKDGDAFHYAALLLKDGKLVELDGMKDGPRELPMITPDHDPDIVACVVDHVRQVTRSNLGEIRYSLLAMVPDHLKELEQLLEGCADKNLCKEIEGKIIEERDRRMLKARSRGDLGKLSDAEQRNLQLALDLMTSSWRNCHGQSS